MRTALSGNRRIYAVFSKICAPVYLLRSAQFWSGCCTVAAHGARPAGFEPASRGLEVRIDKFTAVRCCPETRIFKPNNGTTHLPSFTYVQARCRQTVVSRYKSQEPLQRQGRS